MSITENYYDYFKQAYKKARETASNNGASFSRLDVDDVCITFELLPILHEYTMTVEYIRPCGNRYKLIVYGEDITLCEPTGSPFDETQYGTRFYKGKPDDGESYDLYELVASA